MLTYLHKRSWCQWRTGKCLPCFLPRAAAFRHKWELGGCFEIHHSEEPFGSVRWDAAAVLYSSNSFSGSCLIPSHPQSPWGHFWFMWLSLKPSSDSCHLPISEIHLNTSLKNQAEREVQCQECKENTLVCRTLPCFSLPVLPCPGTCSSLFVLWQLEMFPSFSGPRK